MILLPEKTEDTLPFALRLVVLVKELNWGSSPSLPASSSPSCAGDGASATTDDAGGDDAATGRSSVLAAGFGVATGGPSARICWRLLRPSPSAIVISYSSRPGQI